ncbi:MULTISPECIES: hypothetical protein [unclassified Streptomyces]|uniref:hypothetical protein n=1 Tax=unclassified Streptomyces TaxID=2593676 RepID=UPI00336A7146
MRITRAGRTRNLVVAALAGSLLAGGAAVVAGDDLFTTDASAKPTDIVANAAAAKSSKQSKKQGTSCWTGAREVRNKKFVKTVYEWPDTPDYVQSMPGPAKTTWEYKVDLTSKVSATLGMSEDGISAGLGFEISKTQSRTKKVELNLKEKAHYLARAGIVYKQYQFDVYEERGFWNWYGDYLICQSYQQPTWVKKGSSTALRAWTDTYRVKKVSKRANQPAAVPAYPTYQTA